MRKNKKRILSAVLALLLLALTILPGCAPKEITLRVLTEASKPHNQGHSRFYDQLDTLIEQFMVEHEDVNVVVERLPEAGTEREYAIERLRASIMAGKGPDILVMPSPGTNIYFGAPDEITNEDVLFPDVEQAMHNGLFYDLSEFYDADSELDKDGLVTSVMDAGTVGDARYLLPLRYNFPVAYVYPEKLEGSGLDLEIFDQNMVDLMNTIAESNVEWLIADSTFLNLESSILNYFPQLIDYDSQETRIDKEDLVAFLQSYRTLHSIDRSLPPSACAKAVVYVAIGSFWPQTGHGMYIGDLDSAIEHAAIAKVTGYEIEMFPLKAMDGSLIADITYYGAIGAGCKEPELAYELLRQLLGEETQNQTTATGSGVNGFALAASGWPVRSKGVVQKIYRNFYAKILKGNGFDAERKARENQLKFIDLTDEDIPVLQTTVDQARFSIPWEKTLGQLADEDRLAIDVAVDEWLGNLQWHLGEG